MTAIRHATPRHAARPRSLATPHTQLATDTRGSLPRPDHAGERTETFGGAKEALRQSVGNGADLLLARQGRPKSKNLHIDDDLVIGESLPLDAESAPRAPDETTIREGEIEPARPRKAPARSIGPGSRALPQIPRGSRGRRRIDARCGADPRRPGLPLYHARVAEVRRKRRPSRPPAIVR